MRNIKGHVKTPEELAMQFHIRKYIDYMNIKWYETENYEDDLIASVTV